MTFQVIGRGPYELRNKPIRFLPDSIGNLAELEILDLTNCSLLFLPETIGSCIKLKKLHLDNNKLKTLPTSLANLANLEVLHLAFNKFETLPLAEALLQMPNLKELIVDKAVLEKLPHELLAGSQVTVSAPEGKPNFPHPGKVFAVYDDSRWPS